MTRRRAILNDQVSIVDGILPPPSLSALRSTIAYDDFHDVTIDGATSIWHRNSPLNPKIGRTIVWPERTEYREVASAVSNIETFPTATPVDEVLQAARREAEMLGLLSGGQHYAGIIASFYLYPPGGRLVWHSDEVYLGSFVSYLEPDWRPDWGGYLAMCDTDQQADGVGVLIEPRYNRLVTFAPRIRHAITPIATDARVARLTLAGFFVRTEYADRLLAKVLGDIERLPS